MRLDITADPVGGTPTLEGTLSYTISAGLTTAEAADIGAAAGTLSFSNVSDLASNAVSIAHLNDALVEGAEAYTQSLALNPLPPGMSVSVSSTAFTGTITDGDSATVAISGGATVSEAVGTTPLTVTLTTVAGNTLENGLSVAVDLTGGSATFAADYYFNGPSPSVSVTIPAGAATGFSRNTAVTIAEDALVENSESFSASLGTIMARLSAEISISNHEAAASNAVTVMQAPFSAMLSPSRTRAR